MAIPILPPNEPPDSRAGRAFLDALRINFIEVDSTVAGQTVDLAKVQGTTLVIKDVGGNALANPITILGTVDATVNPTIGTDYGVLKIFSYKSNSGVLSWQSW